LSAFEAGDGLFESAVNPSLEAPAKTSCFRRSRKPIASLERTSPDARFSGV
jgi:hypothetical protein